MPENKAKSYIIMTADYITFCTVCTYRICSIRRRSRLVAALELGKPCKKNLSHAMILSRIPLCPCAFLSSSDPPHFLSSPKIALYLQKAPSSKPFGPSVLEKAGYIRLSFRKGGQEEVSHSPCIRSLSQCIGMEGGTVN